MPIAALSFAHGVAITPRELIEQMADDLVRFDALGSEEDAMRSLLGCERYRASDIGFYFDAAWRVGHQHRIAAEITRS